MRRQKETIKYSIIDPQEDPKFSLILKQGLSTTFTVNDIAAGIKALKKLKSEVEPQVRVAEAKRQNVLHTHPEVKTMDPKLAIAVYLYKHNTEIVEMGLNKLQEIDEQLKEYNQELAEIAKQTGLNTVMFDKPVTAAPTAENLTPNVGSKK